MRSLHKRFEAFSNRNKEVSSFMSFAGAVHGQRFNTKTISYWFRQLIDPEDYDARDWRKLLKHLRHLTNDIEDSTIRGQKSSL